MSYRVLPSLTVPLYVLRSVWAVMNSLTVVLTEKSLSANAFTRCSAIGALEWGCVWLQLICRLPGLMHTYTHTHIYLSSVEMADVWRGGYEANWVISKWFVPDSLFAHWVQEICASLVWRLSAHFVSLHHSMHLIWKKTKSVRMLYGAFSVLKTYHSTTIKKKNT